MVVAPHVHANLARGVGHVQFFAHDAFISFERGEGILHKAFVNANLGADRLGQLRLRQIDVAVVRGFLQYIEGARLNPQGIVVLKAQFAGSGISGDKADAVNVHGKPIGIFAHNGECLRAIGTVDAHSVGWRDTVGLQKKQQVAHAPVFGPGGADAVKALAAHAAHLEQTLWLFIKNTYGVGAKGFHNAPGHFFANALDKAGGEIEADALAGGGQHFIGVLKFDLTAKAGVVDPASRYLELHARLRVDHVPDARNRVAWAGETSIAAAAVYACGQQTQHSVAVLFIVEDNALHRAGEFNGIGIL